MTFDEFIDQMFEQNISESIKPKLIQFHQKKTFPMTILKIDFFEEVSMIGIQDKHNLSYHFYSQPGFKKLKQLEFSFEQKEVAFVIYLPQHKSFIFLLHNMSMCVVDTLGYTPRLALRLPELMVSASKCVPYDELFTVGKSGTVYRFNTKMYFSLMMEQILQAQVQNWRMLQLPIETEQ